MMLRFFLTLLLCFAMVPAHAHTLSVAHLDIAVPQAGGELRLELDVAIRDLVLSLPLDADRDEQVTWAELQAIREPLDRWVLSGLSLSAGPSACALRATGLGTRRYDDGAYATVTLAARCPSHEGLKVRYGLLFALDPQHRALITLRNAATVSTAVASADAPAVAIGAASRLPFLDFLREGIHHILIGYDHLAFLISLLLPAALVRAHRRWQPAVKLKSSAWQILGVVTAFTAAHSITLSLAALGWVTPASRWVEAAIAASVLLAALNNLHPLVTRRIWAVAFVFGLVHGFGFAGALGELGLPTGARLQALLGFNLGVEMGQLAVVAVVLPVLFAVRRKGWYSKIVLPSASLAIAGLAAWWLYARVIG